MPKISPINIMSKSSIEKAIKELKNYQKSLEYKCEEFVRLLAKEGETVAIQKINESPLRNEITLRSEIAPKQSGCDAVLIAVGTTYQHDDYAPFNTLMAIEFGAGIHYNSKTNPNATEYGMGVGTYPGQIHAFDPGGWYYWDDKSQKWKHSYGVKATMPMYSATMKLVTRYKEIARTVFGNG